MIIGPPGPTGLMVIELLLSGWTIGDGSGVSMMSPSFLTTGERIDVVIRGGVRVGWVLKWWSFPGCVFVRLSGPCGGPRVATVNDCFTGALPLTRTTRFTFSPSSKGWSGKKLAPRSPE